MVPELNNNGGVINDDVSSSSPEHDTVGVNGDSDDGAPLSEALVEDCRSTAVSFFIDLLRGHLDCGGFLNILYRTKHSPKKSDQYFFSVLIETLLRHHSSVVVEGSCKKRFKRLAILWGLLIHYRLLSSDDESYALDIILKSLENKETVCDKKRFLFATTALEKFVDRLDDWPNYATSILNALNLHRLRGSHPELFPRKRLRRALAKYAPGYNSRPTTTADHRAAADDVDVGPTPTPTTEEAATAVILIFQPLELVAEILAWLPVKSLLRFKSVCKEWRSLIESPDFVAEHHKRSKKQLLVLSRKATEDTISSLFCQTISVMNPKPRDLAFYEIKLHRNGSHILGSVNGIFFIQVRWISALWNPATCEIRILPDLQFSIPSGRGEVVLGGGGVAQHYEFGFDAKTNDYKVMFMRDYYFRHDDGGTYCWLFAKLYRLSSNSWTEIELLPAGWEWLARACPIPHIRIEGMFCWLGLDIDECLVILSFDFSDEAMTITWLPDIYNKKACIHTDGQNLFVLDGYIALVNHLIDDWQGYYEIWVLNEIGNDKSWTKLHEFGPCSDLNLPLGNLASQELFHESGELIWLNPVDPTVRHLHEPGDKEFNASFYPESFRYQESLVKINRK